MADPETTPTPQGGQEGGGTFTPITTQEDFDKAFNHIFAERIGKERDKYKDFDQGSPPHARGAP